MMTSESLLGPVRKATSSPIITPLFLTMPAWTTEGAGAGVGVGSGWGAGVGGMSGGVVGMGVMSGSGVALGEAPAVADGLSGGAVAGASAVTDPQAASDSVRSITSAMDKALAMFLLICI